jgi:hypothetical protein
MYFGRNEAVVGNFLGVDFFNFYAERLNKSWAYRFGTAYIMHQEVTTKIK